LSDVGAMVAELIAAGCAPEVAAKVVARAYVAGVSSAEFRGIPPDSAAEKRRAYDRERKRKSTGIPPESTGIPNSPLSSSNLKKERKGRGSRIPPEWKPERDLAKQLGWSDAQIDQEAENFRDYWLGRAGSGGVKLDWPATWRKWVRSSRTKPAGSVPGHIVNPEAVNWRAVLQSYKNFGNWPKGHGNDPTSPSCRAPPALLREYGFQQREAS
jgi:hypothetical protein